MQTHFTPQQLQNPGLAYANDILRSCVHCGFCTATCPTYQVLGDELDSPRGRIYLIKDMLETGRAADEKTVKHIDRCLSCLACMTTCPSGVNYMHLVDMARAYIEDTYERPLSDRLLRWVLARILPYPKRFRLAVLGAWIGRPFGFLVPRKYRVLLEMAPQSLPPVSRNDDPQVFAPTGARKMRVALMTGCAQKALNTDINDATIRLLRRLGCEVVVAKDTGCCGAMSHHMGKTPDSKHMAARNIAAWKAEIDGAGLDAIVVNTSGCGTHVKDYGHLFDQDSLADTAAEVAGLTRDITEVLAQLDLPEGGAPSLRIAYHAACSLQHGQKIVAEPKTLLQRAGYEVMSPQDSHLCCGSAGTYNLLQPDIANQLQARKAATLDALAPDVIAAGNIGCMIQIGAASTVPVVHTVELLDWATGGPKPHSLCATTE